VSKPQARKKLANFSRVVRGTAVILAIASRSRWRASRTEGDRGTFADGEVASPKIRAVIGLPWLQHGRDAGAASRFQGDDRHQEVASLSRRKGEITSRMRERDYPHIVELPLPPSGFRSQSDDMLAFHRERGIEPRRGRGWHDDEQYYVRYCFADPAHADAFRERFGGEKLTTPPPRGRARC
jgi:hypothetical protein